MSEERWLRLSDRWLRLLLWLYPSEFREEMGEAVVEAYRDRCRSALRRSGVAGVGWVWVRALADSLRNGLGERLSPAVAWRRLGNWGRDGELVARRLMRAPVFVLIMVGTLTVGLGAFAVVYTAVDRVLLAPLPYEDPDDLYYVWRDYGWFDLDRGWLGGTDIAELQAAGGVIEDAAGMTRPLMTLAGSAVGEPEEVPVMVSSPGLFELLGVRPVLGRGFAPDEVGPDREPVIVLGHDLWQRQFGGDPAIVGSEVRLNGDPYTVIGVMGRGFRFARHGSLGPPAPADAFITFSLDLAATNPGAGSYAGLIRARAGTPPEAVEAAVRAVGARLDERDFQGRGLRLYPVGVKEDLVGGVRPALTVLGMAGVFLVIVLMVNLAALLLARAAQREREFAISRALGANRLAVARATLLEGGVLGVLGGAGGALAAVWGTRLLVSLGPPDLPRLETIAVDWRIAAVVVGVGALVGLLAGAVPAVWATRSRLATLLSNTAVRGGGGHARLRKGMVVVQVALSLVLLSAGGLVVRSFDQLLRADPGFRPANVLTLRIPLPAQAYPDSATVRAAHERIEQELGALPGVRAVGATTSLPFMGRANQTDARFPGAPGNTGEAERDSPLVDYIRIRPGYLATLGIRVLAGRDFDRAAPAGVREAVIDHTLAARFFPAGDPVGATLVLGGDSLTVIGVAQHARLYDVHRDDRPQVYVRNESPTFSGLSWAVLAERPAGGMIRDVRAAVRRVDPELAISELQPLDRLVAESLGEQRLSAALIGGFSLGALLLAAMGLFGVVSGSVTRRRQELAVRLALGADHARVLRLVFREGALLVLIGLLVGVPGIYFAGRLIRGMLVDVSPFDPLTLGAVATGLALIALAACYVPARRVTGIEPAALLKQE